MARRGNLTDVASVTLQPLYCTPRSLSAEKVADIKKLLKYVPPVHHSFSQAIIDKVLPTPQQHYYEDELLSESEKSDDDCVLEVAQSGMRKRLAFNKPTVNNKTDKSDRKSCRPTQQVPSVYSTRSCNKSADVNPSNTWLQYLERRKNEATSFKKIKKQ